MKLLRWVGGIVAPLGTALGASYPWVSRDHGATHPALAEAALVPLIPTNQFWADTDAEWAYRVSADGGFITYRAVRLLRISIPPVRTAAAKSC